MGSAAVVVMEGDWEAHSKKTSVLWKRALPCTCSYEEEVKAMKLATTWIKKICEEEETIQISTDRQSFCKDLQSYNPETEHIKGGSCRAMKGRLISSGYPATPTYQEITWLIEWPDRQPVCWGSEDQSLTEAQ